MATDWGRIAVGIRSGGSPDPVFMDRFMMFVSNGLREDDVLLHSAIDYPHAPAANILALQAIKFPQFVDSVLYVDDDMVIDYDALEKLRAVETDCSVLSALMVCRRGHLLPIAIKLGDSGRHSMVEIRNPVEEVDVVGLGFTLIKREVLEGVMKLHKDERGPFSWHNVLGEDGQFCQDAKKLGYRVGVSRDVRVGHRARVTLYWNCDKNTTDVVYETRK